MSETTKEPLSDIPRDKLELLLKLPLLLNSSLDTRQVVTVAIQHLKLVSQSEAATVFLLNDAGTELLFWAIQGSEAQKLKDLKIPADKGVVGWVLREQKSVRINDVASDPRFFKDVDSESEFKTKSMLCVPLTARGTRRLGAIQALNKKDGSGFTEQDLAFAEQLANQLSLAIDNSKLYEESVRRGAMLEKLSKRKDEMIAVITHEFRTPLSIIQGSADLLGSGSIDPDSAAQLSKSLLTGVKRLTSLISEVRNISKVQSAKIEPKEQEVELVELVDDIVLRVKPNVDSRKLNLETAIDAKVVKVRCDPALITVALYNLVSNAIRFTADGGKIKIAAKPSPGVVEVSVVDTGIGIEANEIPLIFEKFYEVGEASKHSSGTFEFKSGGLGLGLPVAKNIIEAHGSSIDVKSVFGKGSEFSFRLKSA